MYLLDFHLWPQMTAILHIVIAEQESTFTTWAEPLGGDVLMFVSAKRAALLQGQTLSEAGSSWNMPGLPQGTVPSPAGNQQPSKPESTFDSTSAALSTCN